jgi:hypothetical protein
LFFTDESEWNEVGPIIHLAKCNMPGKPDEAAIAVYMMCEIEDETGAPAERISTMYMPLINYVHSEWAIQALGSVKEMRKGFKRLPRMFMRYFLDTENMESTDDDSDTGISNGADNSAKKKSKAEKAKEGGRKNYSEDDTGFFAGGK